MRAKLLTFIASLLSVLINTTSATTVFAIDGNAKSAASTAIGSAGGGSGSTVPETLQSIIGILLFIAGVVAVVVIVVSGFRYVVSNGDAAAASRAKNGIIYALIGLVVAIMAYAIVNFILGNI